jgi:hypothetical protein
MKFDAARKWSGFKTNGELFENWISKIRIFLQGFRVTISSITFNGRRVQLQKR